MEIIAHRGSTQRWLAQAQGAPPVENTIAAFDLAREQGATGLEFDVRLAACGEPVILHDASLARTHGTDAEVLSLPAATLETLGVPLLASVLWRYGGEMRLFVEAKTRDAALAAAAQIELLNASGAQRALTVLISFDHTALAHAHALHPGIVFGASFEQSPETAIVETLSFTPRWLAVRSDGISARTVAYAAQTGRALVAWTVNDAAHARRLRLLGVEALMTDLPSSAQEWLK